MPSSSPVRPLQGRVPELDGLRGAAIFMAVVFHYLEQQGAVAGGGLTPILQRLVLMGWSGMDLFFVLSGFLIGGVLVDARNSPSYFKTFYTRRFFRIIPIYYLWILAYVVLVGVAGSFLRAHSNSGLIMESGAPIYSHFFFLQNLMVIPFAGLAGAWFSHLWSLAFEEQFYLISSLVVRLLSMRSLTIFLAFVIAAAPLLRVVLLAERADPSLVSGLMPCRADSLAIGMLAAIFWRRERFRAGRTFRRCRGPLEVVAGIADLGDGVDRLHMAGRVLCCNFAACIGSEGGSDHPVGTHGVAVRAWPGLVLCLHHPSRSECDLSFDIAQSVICHFGLARRSYFSPLL